MKTTIDIPDELYRQVKARAALQGRPIRELTVELYQRWLREAPAPTEDSPATWLRSWLELADGFMAGAPPGPSAREILERDRERLGREQ
ncbi:MAG: hypothetical protein JXA57_06490 [Armatimonadetes bacterium]|nr:hypothetical protein [Armatimonadota bacterium]